MTPAADGALMDVRDLSVQFRARGGVARAVDGVTLEWRRGEVLGVVGESGAGKSITGTAVIGLIEPPGRIAGGQVLLLSLIHI